MENKFTIYFNDSVIFLVYSTLDKIKEILNRASKLYVNQKDYVHNLLALFVIENMNLLAPKDKKDEIDSDYFIDFTYNWKTWNHVSVVLSDKNSKIYFESS